MGKPNTQHNLSNIINKQDRLFMETVGQKRLAIGLICWIPFIIATLGNSRSGGYHPPAPPFVRALLIYGLPLALCVGIPYIITGIGLWRRSRWAIWNALIYDGALVSCIIGCYITSHFLIIYQQGSLLGAITLIVFDIIFWVFGIVEGLYLLRSLANPLVHRLSYIAVAVTILATVSLISASIGLRRIAEYKPLISYVRANWVDFTKTSGAKYVYSFSRYRFSSSPLHDDWIVTPSVVNSDIWLFKGRSDYTAQNVAMKLITTSLYKTRVGSEYQARNILRDVGVQDPNLLSVGEKYIFGDHGYCFWSPKAGGTFYVDSKGGGVRLYLQQSAIVYKTVP